MFFITIQYTIITDENKSDQENREKLAKQHATLLYVAKRQKATAEVKGRLPKGTMAHCISKALRLYWLSMEITHALIEKIIRRRNYTIFHPGTPLPMLTVEPLIAKISKMNANIRQPLCQTKFSGL